MQGGGEEDKDIKVEEKTATGIFWLTGGSGGAWRLLSAAEGCVARAHHVSESGDHDGHILLRTFTGRIGGEEQWMWGGGEEGGRSVELFISFSLGAFFLVLKIKTENPLSMPAIQTPLLSYALN